MWKFMHRRLWILPAAITAALMGCAVQENGTPATTADEQPVHATAMAMEISPERSALLPRQAVVDFLRASPATESKVSVVSLDVTSFPEASLFAGFATADRPISIPLQAGNQVLIQLRPDVSESEYRDLLESVDLQVVRTMPELGVLVVAVPDLVNPGAELRISDLGEVKELEVGRVISELEGNPIVASATPDSFLSTFVLRSAVSYRQPDIRLSQEGGEHEDWGIAAATIDQVWPRLSGPIKVGVIDIGFGQHSDLDLEKGLQTADRIDDHGTHVAGIMCAKHNDQGIRGVLKNCTVVYTSSNSLLRRIDSIEGRDVVAMSTLLSEYLGTVLDFIVANPEIKTINLSLGYNWLPGFSRDPRDDRVIRDLVKGQGRIYYSLLAYAKSLDIALVSAAGNDSTGMANPLDAKWASPFNFGAQLMHKNDGWSNALVIEAHDRQGRRAAFSNSGGDLACPGVDILSTVAEPEDHISLMSGTSMASPYCAAGLAALRNIMPDLKLRDAVRCLRNGRIFENGVPRLDLAYAIDNCSETDVDESVDDRIRVLEEWATVLAEEDEAMPSPASENICRYNLRTSFPVTDVADQGDGQGPEFVSEGARKAIDTYVAQLLASNCDDPVFVVLPLQFQPDFGASYEFALAIMSMIQAAKYPGEVVIVEWPTFRRYEVELDLDGRVIVMVGDKTLRDSLVTVPGSAL